MQPSVVWADLPESVLPPPVAQTNALRWAPKPLLRVFPDQWERSASDSNFILASNWERVRSPMKEGYIDR